MKPIRCRSTDAQGNKGRSQRRRASTSSPRANRLCCLPTTTSARSVPRPRWPPIPAFRRDVPVIAKQELIQRHAPDIDQVSQRGDSVTSFDDFCAVDPDHFPRNGRGKTDDGCTAQEHDMQCKRRRSLSIVAVSLFNSSHASVQLSRHACLTNSMSGKPIAALNSLGCPAPPRGCRSNQHRQPQARGFGYRLLPIGRSINSAPNTSSGSPAKDDEAPSETCCCSNPGNPLHRRYLSIEIATAPSGR